MTWSQRYRVRSFLKNSIWFFPFLSILFAIGLVRLISRIEPAVGWQGTFSVEGDRAIFTAMASSMLTFIVLVFSMLLVVVQLASAQLSPRIIATAFRDRVTKFALTVFVFTFTFSLALVRRIDSSVPPISELIATFSNVTAAGVYLYSIDHVGQMLRPVSFISRVATEGRAVIETIYPRRLGEREEEQAHAADLSSGSPSRIVEHSGDGVFLAFDEVGLVELARRTDCVIELVLQVGDFVAKGSALFRLHGGGPLAENELQQRVAFGPVMGWTACISTPALQDRLRRSRSMDRGSPRRAEQRGAGIVAP